MDENETNIEDTNEVEDLTALDDVEETDATDWEALAKKNAGIAKRALTKLAKANEKKPEEPVKTETAQKTDGLSETQLDYLDVKGITDADEIDVIQRVIAKTGQTVRQALQDDYVIAKLETIRADKAVKDATPSATKRGNQDSSSTLAADIAKFERSNELPDDFARRSAVVNAIADRSSVNKPSWK